MKRQNQFKSKSKPKLNIYKRDDKKSSCWYGSFYIDGKEKTKSSETAVKRQAIKILEKWHDEVNIKFTNDIPIHDTTIKSCLNAYIKDVRNSSRIEPTSKNTLIRRWNKIKQCEKFMNLNIQKCKVADIERTFLRWIIPQNSNKGISYRGRTLQGYLTNITAFFTWCYETNLRKTKMSGLLKQLPKELSQQSTSRASFEKEEYETLKKVSRERYLRGRSHRIRFDREKLHWFIIFMCGTGLRVDECMSLHWEDIRPIDRGSKYRHEDERYLLKINIRQSKIKKDREVRSMASAYFAYKRLMKLYRVNDIDITGNIWGIKSFRTGLNDLLDEANLKTTIIGGRELKRDSKSFRSYYIITRIQQGVPHNAIAQNCGTSTAMIDKHYSCYQQLDDMLDVLNQTDRSKQSKLKLVE